MISVLAVCKYVYCICAWSPHMSKQDIRSPGPGVPDVSHHVGAENQTPVLCKSSKCSKPFKSKSK